jgi:hypothetical protein
MDEELERILRIEIPPCGAQSSDGANYDNFFLNGWSNTGNTFHWEGSIDLSGYALDRKTFYPMTTIYQKAASYVNFGGSSVTELLVVTSIPISTTDLFAYMSNVTGPGFTQSGATNAEQQDWTTVLFGQVNTYMINSTLPALGICQPITSNSFGSLSPTAADKLYIYKVIVPGTLSGVIGNSIAIPSSRIVIPGSMMQEPKLEYMMRLKRSYELANQV